MPLSLSARDTVILDTPASSARSAIVIGAAERAAAFAPRLDLLMRCV
jgi:hypothetical protein